MRFTQKKVSILVLLVVFVFLSCACAGAPEEYALDLDKFPSITSVVGERELVSTDVSANDDGSTIKTFTYGSLSHEDYAQYSDLLISEYGFSKGEGGLLYADSKNEGMRISVELADNVVELSKRAK